MMRLFFLSLFLSGLLASCTAEMASNLRHPEQELLAFEMQSELAELKRQVNGHQVDLQILEEKLLKTQQETKMHGQREALVLLEKKVAELEKMQNKIVVDLRELAANTHQSHSSIRQYAEKMLSCESQLADMREKFSEVVKLKSTLTSISKAMGTTAATKTYKVRSGDSLEKIARANNTTSEELKKINGLSHDTIMIGQELKLP